MRLIKQGGNDAADVEAEVELLLETGVVSAKARDHVAAVLYARRLLKGIEREPGLDELPRLLAQLREAVDSIKRDGDRLGELGDVLKPLENDRRCTELMSQLFAAICDFRHAVGAVRIPEYHELEDVARIRNVIDTVIRELQHIMRV